MHENVIELCVTIIISLLAVAVISSMLLKKIRCPYTIGLVIIGGVWAMLAHHVEALSPMRNLTLSPDAILFIILPTLIFDAAINIDIRVLFKNMVPILLLAAVGIIVSAGVIGVSLPYFTPLALGGALLFGALISATDPVAVIALFNEVKAPKRLLTLIDGESIFNDATAIVLFTIFLETQINNYGDLVHLGGPGLVSFVLVLCGGVLIGGFVGLVGSFLLRIKKGDMILQFTVTLIIAYLSFILADKFGTSGVISTLTAGLVYSGMTNITIKRRHRESLHYFWEYFSFTANSLVFLLLGFTEFNIFNTDKSITNSLGIILLSIPVIIVARICVIYTLVPIYNKFTKPSRKIPGSYQAILLWGGLRGAVPVALVFSIPPSYPHRALLLHLTFTFILFTLLVQGTTIKKLMDMLGISPERNALDGIKHVTTYAHSFKSEYLASLIIKRLLDIFSEEGFFTAKDHDSNSVNAYVLKKKDIVVLAEQDSQELKFTYQEENRDYLHTILYEALLEFGKSLQEVSEIVRPEKLSELVHNQYEQPTRSHRKRKGLNLAKYILEDQILTSMVSTTKEGIIAELIDVVAKKGLIPDKDAALEALMARERIMTTGIGDSIALPHAKITGIKDIVAVMGIKRDGMDFEAMDNKPTKIFVLILSPENDPVPHIEFLASITRVLGDKETKAKILTASAKEIHELL